MSPSRDEVKRIEPLPCFVMWRPAYFTARKQLTVLMRQTSFHSSTLCSSNGVLVPGQPALAKNTSSPPNSATQRATMASTLASTVTSVTIAAARPPAA